MVTDYREHRRPCQPVRETDILTRFIQHIQELTPVPASNSFKSSGILAHNWYEMVKEPARRSRTSTDGYSKYAAVVRELQSASELPSCGTLQNTTPRVLSTRLRSDDVSAADTSICFIRSPVCRKHSSNTFISKIYMTKFKTMDVTLSAIQKSIRVTDITLP